MIRYGERLAQVLLALPGPYSNGREFLRVVDRCEDSYWSTSQIAGRLGSLQAAGLVTNDGSRWRRTRAGDYVLKYFVAEDVPLPEPAPIIRWRPGWGERVPEPQPIEEYNGVESE